MVTGEHRAVDPWPLGGGLGRHDRRPGLVAARDRDHAQLSITSLWPLCVIDVSRPPFAYHRVVWDSPFAASGAGATPSSRQGR